MVVGCVDFDRVGYRRSRRRVVEELLRWKAAMGGEKLRSETAVIAIGDLV